MIDVANQFGIRVLRALAEQKGETSIAISPPALFLPLAMLRSNASGLTRAGLNRVLGINETITEAERDLRTQSLVQILKSAPVSFDAALQSRGQSPFSPAFLKRAQEVFSVPVEIDETSLPFRLRSRFSATLTLTGTGREVHESHVTAISLPFTASSLELCFLIPKKAAFWQKRNTPLEQLLKNLNSATLAGWQTHLTTANGSMSAIPAIPLHARNSELLPKLSSLDFGLAITPAAEFSSMT